MLQSGQVGFLGLHPLSQDIAALWYQWYPEKYYEWNMRINIDKCLEPYVSAISRISSW